MAIGHLVCVLGDGRRVTVHGYVQDVEAAAQRLEQHDSQREDVDFLGVDVAIHHFWRHVQPAANLQGHGHVSKHSAASCSGLPPRGKHVSDATADLPWQRIAVSGEHPLIRQQRLDVGMDDCGPAKAAVRERANVHSQWPV